MSANRRTSATPSFAETLGLRSLRQRLSLVPVAVVLGVSLIAHLFVHHRARTELYESREELARGLADNVAQHLSDQLSEIRDELFSWARFLAGPTAGSMPGATKHEKFQAWLRGLGDSATSRYDVIALLERDGTIIAINEMGLSVPIADPLATTGFLGKTSGVLLGQADETWVRRTLDAGLPSGLPWRSIPEVNRLYARSAPKTRDDIVRTHQLVFAVPVREPNGSLTTGALVAVASWAPFQRILDEAEAYMTGVGLRTGYGFILDEGGDHTIGHKLRDPLPPGQNLLGSSVSRDNNLPHVRDAAVSATGRAFEYDFPPGNKKFAVFLKVDAPGAGQGYAFDWRLGIGVDHRDIFAPLARLRNAVIWATLAVALAVAVVGVWLGRTLSLSVKEFTHLAKEAAAGRFDLVSSRSASQGEISELSDAMNQLFVSMRQRTDLQPISNPYVVGNPVRSAAMFYGRQQDLQWIADRLRQAGNEIILLYGQRRIGKTSLLHQIRNQRESASVLPVFVDTHGLLPMLRGDDDFYSGLARTVSRELSLGAGYHAEEDGQTAEHLLAMVRSLNMQFPTQTVVLLFDEIDALDMKIRDRTLSPGITSFLWSLLESDSRVSIIASGSADGSRLGGPFWSGLAPKSIGRRIGLLSRSEGMRLIREPVSGQVEFEDDVLERILRVTGAHPYYTQTVCQRLIDTLNERHSRRVSHDVVTHVIDRLLAEPPLPLDDMWSGSTPLQCWAMAELARLLSDPEGSVNADALLVATTHPPADVVSELRRLTAIEILEESSGRYRFPVDFIRLWIRKEQLWWGVAQQRRHSG